MVNVNLLPNGMQQFADANGVPYALGKVYMEIPNTNTPKDNWQDQGHVALNTYPIDLDAAGRCVIWGDGLYRQRLLDKNAVEIWDKLTVSAITLEELTSILSVSLVAFTDLPWYIGGKPGDGETFPIYLPVRTLVLPAGLVGSRFRVDPAKLPTASATFTLYKNAGSIGTITFSTLGVVTIVFTLDVTLTTGDTFSMVAPSPQDATMEAVSFTFKCEVP